MCLFLTGGLLNGSMIKQMKGHKCLAIAMLWLMTMALSGCETDIQKIKLVTDRKELPTITATHTDLMYSDSAHVKVRLKAPISERYLGDAPYIVFPNGAYAEFYDLNGKVTSSITAKYAISKDRDRTMEAKGQVVVVNVKGDTLNTEHLIWNQDKEKIISDDYVKITTADKIIYGKGMEADQSFTQYRIFNIRGTININKEEENATRP